MGAKAQALSWSRTGNGLYIGLADKTTLLICFYHRAIDSGINKAVAARLQSQVSQVRPPLQAKEQPRKPHVAAAPLATALPAALLALAALVLVAASAATIYICASWSRYGVIL